mmetsp:Transcript_3912/g.15927  ORF Transcript_3912/g.15927 Transcript_3912/m.15927 type:complete len:326 (-) Transcript_3912:1073-2050(-)
MAGVDLEGLATTHVRHAPVVAERLRLHDALHVGGPAVLAGDNRARSGDEAVGDLHRLHLLGGEDLLPPLGEVLEFLLDLLQASLGGFRVVAKLEIILGRVGELEVVKLGQVLHGVLVDGIGEVDHLEILLQELLEERRLLERLARLAREVVDGLLSGLHALHVLLEGDELGGGLGGVEAHELGEAGAVGRVLDDAQLDRLSVVLPELVVLGLLLVGGVVGGGVCSLLVVVILPFLGELADHVERLANELLLDGLEAGMLLQGLAADVQGQGVRVDDALDEREVLGQELVELVGDEHAADVELERRSLVVVVVEEVLGGLLRNEQD